MYKLKTKEFEYISNKVYEFAKINLTEKKRSLIISRLSKRIRILNMSGFSEYIEYLENNDHNGEEFQIMIDTLSTNFSNFFREPDHFDFLTKKILPYIGNDNLKIWSAASSTGQEVYSISMTIKEFEKNNHKKLDYDLIASDISREVLIKASKGIYNLDDVKKIDNKLLKKYFLRGTGVNSNKAKIKNDLIKTVNFMHINLNDNNYHVPKMDVIFLRNVIIYFDKETKVDIINRLYSYIKPKGYLFIGHSESLSGICDKFDFIEKSVYRRKD